MTTYNLSSMTIPYKIKQLFTNILKNIENSKYLEICDWFGELDLESKILTVYVTINQNARFTDMRGYMSSETETESVKLSDTDFNELVNEHQYNVALKEYEERKYLEEQRAIEKIRKELFP